MFFLNTIKYNLFTGRGTINFYMPLCKSMYLYECRKRTHYQLFYYLTQKHYFFVLTEVKIKV